MTSVRTVTLRSTLRHIRRRTPTDTTLRTAFPMTLSLEWSSTCQRRTARRRSPATLQRRRSQRDQRIGQHSHHDRPETHADRRSPASVEYSLATLPNSDNSDTDTLRCDFRGIVHCARVVQRSGPHHSVPHLVSAPPGRPVHHQTSPLAAHSRRSHPTSRLPVRGAFAPLTRFPNQLTGQPPCVITGTQRAICYPGRLKQTEEEDAYGKAWVFSRVPLNALSDIRGATIL